MFSSAVAVAAALLTVLAGCKSGDDEPPDADNDSFADSVDCAPQDARAWQVLTFASRDDDTDGFRANNGGQLCGGAALPVNRFAAAAALADVDCDDASATRWALRHHEAVDTDRDGFAVAGAGDLCTGAALPAGYVAALPATADLDCDDADAAKWRLHSYGSRDQDGDGWRVNTAGTLCGQNALPGNLHVAAVSAGYVDCDDADLLRWRLLGIYRDLDGDGTGSGTVVRQCIGASVPNGYAFAGYDPLDDPANPLSAAISNVELPSHLLLASDDGDDDDIF